MIPENVSLEVVDSESKASRTVGVDWDKIAKIVAAAAFLFTIVTFLWTFHNEVVALTQKTSILEGQMTVLLQDRKESNLKLIIPSPSPQPIKSE